MERSVFEALERGLSGNRPPGWARRARERSRRARGYAYTVCDGDESLSLGTPEGLFGRSWSRSLTPLRVSRVSFGRVRQQRPSSSPAASPVSAPICLSGTNSIRPETPSMAARPRQKPLPSDFLEQPWVQRYLNETKGMLSVLTLEQMAVRWELERTNPEEAAAQAKARAERSPAAQARRRKREQARLRQAHLERKRAQETARLAHLQAERQKHIQAEEDAAAQIALAKAAAEAAAAELAKKEEAAKAERRKVELQRLWEASATMIQRVYRGRVWRMQHRALLQTPVVVLSIIGGPGSGKTMLCKRLVADESLRKAGVSFCHLSTGALLRQAARPRHHSKRHPHSEMIRILMDEGELVPNAIVSNIVQNEITEFRYRAGRYAHCNKSQAAPQANLVLLDGFPMTAEQANMLDETPVGLVCICPPCMTHHTPYVAAPFRRQCRTFYAGMGPSDSPYGDACPCMQMVSLRCEAEESIRRVMKRGETSGRSDDTEETANTVLARFEKHSATVIKEFTAKQIIRTIENGVGHSAEDAYDQLLAHVMHMIQQASLPASEPVCASPDGASESARPDGASESARETSTLEIATSSEQHLSDATPTMESATPSTVGPTTAKEL